MSILSVGTCRSSFRAWLPAVPGQAAGLPRAPIVARASYLTLTWDRPAVKGWSEGCVRRVAVCGRWPRTAGRRVSRETSQGSDASPAHVAPACLHAAAPVPVRPVRLPTQVPRSRDYRDNRRGMPSSSPRARAWSPRPAAQPPDRTPERDIVRPLAASVYSRPDAVSHGHVQPMKTGHRKIASRTTTA